MNECGCSCPCGWFCGCGCNGPGGPCSNASKTELKAMAARTAIHALLKEELTDGMRGILKNTNICLDVLIDRLNPYG